MPDYSPVPTSALLMLAALIIKRTRLSLPVNSREQAISIIRGIRPAPPRRKPLHTHTAHCATCHEPIPVGTLCDAEGTRHINCQGDSHDKM
jgi:hypothetical protein